MAENPLTRECTRLVKAFGYSWDGIKATYATEPAFRIECWCLPFAVLLSFLLGETAAETALLLGASLLVPLVELLNSAIEAVVNLASPERHPLAKKAKDAASAAVLIALVLAGGVWGCVLLN